MPVPAITPTYPMSISALIWCYMGKRLYEESAEAFSSYIPYLLTWQFIHRPVVYQSLLFHMKLTPNKPTLGYLSCCLLSHRTEDHPNQ